MYQFKAHHTVGYRLHTRLHTELGIYGDLENVGKQVSSGWRRRSVETCVWAGNEIKIIGRKQRSKTTISSPVMTIYTLD